MSAYDVIYLIGNLFQGYIYLKFLRTFHGNSTLPKHVEYLSFLLFSILITYIHLHIQIPIIVLFSNIVMILLLSLQYSKNIKSVIVGCILVSMVFLCIELIIVVLTTYNDITITYAFEYQSIVGLVLVRVLAFVFVLLYSRLKRGRGDFQLSWGYWLSLICVPASTLILFLSVLYRHTVSNTVLIICTICVLLINALSFYLYDYISILVTERMEKKIDSIQINYYEKQIDTMKEALEQYKTIKHDLRNKLSPLLRLAHKNDIEELVNRISELTDIMTGDTSFASSGNADIDSIVNFKLQEAKNLGASIQFKAQIPTSLEVPSFDIATILGNILDNAIEAVSRVEERWIHMYLTYEKGILKITSTNSYCGTVKKDKGKYISTKQDIINHGYGIPSIQKTAQKYDGATQITHDENQFTIKVLLYLNLIGGKPVHEPISQQPNHKVHRNEDNQSGR